ncbi:MAG TPA: hypothetical protein VJQ08_03665 [Candidatus Dormibacteraeota bacterium]|nr:hypothetical protein [Candidatus Dormibacteraeota bacterium]
MAAAVIAVAGASCDPTLGLTLPSERALEDGAAGGLANSKTVELKGSYTSGGVQWTVDWQLTAAAQHVSASGQGVGVEAIVTGKVAYFRGQQFLATHLGSDPLSQNLVKVAGNAWWKGSSGLLPAMKDFTDGPTFRATFLGSANTHRTDHQTLSGQEVVQLSGTRADVYIAAAPPYRLVRVHLKKAVVVDALADADLRYSNYDRVPPITAPTNVIDFSNLSTLPPVYIVQSVDTSGCGAPCVVSATLKNLGGATGASGPSVVTFTLTAAISGSVLGTCQSFVVPDVGYNGTTAVSCTINVSAQPENAAVVTATVDNPGRAS